MPFGIVAVPPTGSVATVVLRQNRVLPFAAGTVIAVVLPSLTMNSWPVSEFSGRASPGGLKRGSRQVPVHIVAPAGSIFAFAWVSL